MDSLLLAIHHGTLPNISGLRRTRFDCPQLPILTSSRFFLAPFLTCATFEPEQLRLIALVAAKQPAAPGFVIADCQRRGSFVVTLYSVDRARCLRVNLRRTRYGGCSISCSTPKGHSLTARMQLAACVLYSRPLGFQGTNLVAWNSRIFFAHWPPNCEGVLCLVFITGNRRKIRNLLRCLVCAADFNPDGRRALCSGQRIRN